MPVQEILQNKLNVSSIKLTPVGGGSINETFKVLTPEQSFFCKVNSATKFPHLFKQEKQGLEIIRKQNIIQTPEVIDCFEEEDRQFLILNWIESGERTERFWKTFGEQLAALHKISNDGFGLSEDNYMGSIPQLNTSHADWIYFFQTYRLHPLIKQCRDRELLSPHHIKQFENVMDRFQDIFNLELPSLLHGDLWSGNFMCNTASRPVLIDPAVYFGHRSMDLAMTTLFGGFRQPFYEAYHYHFPLPANYQVQWKVCNLYPLLIHLLLFGKSYLHQIESTLLDFQ